MDGKIKFGIGFVSGRTNVCDIINHTYKQLLNQLKKEEQEVELTIFILFDLVYQYNSTKADFYKISEDVKKHIKIKYITPEDIEEEKETLTKQGILTKHEANLFFGYGYARARNTLLYNALRDGINYFLFWDDDEYPVACIQNEKNSKLEWKLQDNLLTHLKYIKDADITFGHRCGYNSPIPYVDIDKVDVEAFKAYIEAVKNEFLTWEQLKTYLLENSGITYADREIANGIGAREMQNNGSHKWVSGSPLALNLDHIEKIPAFYNPEGARGEDTFFSLSIDNAKAISVPVYHFHDAFLKYTNILKHKYPRSLAKIKPDDTFIENRFFNVSRGWIKYRPLYLYITNPEHYKEEIEITKQNLKKGIPEVNKLFTAEDFNILLLDLQEYDQNVERDYDDFLRTKKIWEKLRGILKNNYKSVS